MKKFITILCVVWLALPALNGQIVRHSFRTSDGLIEIEKLASNEVVFLFDDFKSGVVYYPNQRLAQMRLNYRLLADEFIVEDRGGRHRSLATGTPFDSLVVNNMVFVYLDGQGFFEKVTRGAVTFLVKHNSSYTIEEIRSDSYGQAGSSAALQESHVIQINRNTSQGHTGDIRHENSTGNSMMVSVVRRPIIGVMDNGVFVQISNRRQLLRQFPEQRSELRRFISDNNIDLDNTTDVTKLAEYLSALK